MSYRELVDAEARLTILRLTREGSGEASDSVLRSGLEYMSGQRISLDRTRAHMRFLEDKGLLAVRELPGGGLAAAVTERGADVASGAAKADGVAEPEPWDR